MKVIPKYARHVREKKCTFYGWPKKIVILWKKANVSFPLSLSSQGCTDKVLDRQFFLLLAMLGEVVGALHSLTYINPYSKIDPGCDGPG